jgi:hypothetical protein
MTYLAQDPTLQDFQNEVWWIVLIKLLGVFVLLLLLTLFTALSAVITRMNGDTDPPTWRDAEGRAVVPHGFRSSFRTWVDDTRPEDADAAERALAHEDANAVRGAYRRSDLFDRRIPLMRAWAEWCDGGADRVAPSSSDIADEAYTSAAEGGKRSS